VIGLRQLFFCTLLGLLIAWPVAGGPQASGSTLRFSRLTIEDGLSQSSVRCILQDRRGFVWLGTEDGLNRYDGRQFRVYRQDPDGTGELRSSIIWTMHEDRQGTLWVGTDGGGLERYNRETDRFTNLSHDPQQPDSLSHDAVRAITEGPDGRLWVGTAGGGLNCYDPASGRFTRFRNRPGDDQSLSCDVVRSLCFDDAGLLWIATFGGGLDCLNPKSVRFTHHRNDPADPTSLASDHLRVVRVDRQGVVWVGTAQNGLDRLVPAQGRFEHHRHEPQRRDSLSDNGVWAIAEDHLGTLWVGTNNGLCQCTAVDQRPPGTLLRFIRHHPNAEDQHSLSQGRIRCIAEDRAEVLWIGTYNGGLSLTERRPGIFRHLRRIPTDEENLSDNEVRAFCEAGEGRVWVGTYHGGLDLFHCDTMSFSRPGNRSGLDSLNRLAVMSLARDPSADLWIGTATGRLIRFDPDADRISEVRLPAAPGLQTPEPVRTLLIDPDGTLWIGTYGNGLIQREPAGGRLTRFSHSPDDPQSLGHDEVWAQLRDRSGTLWIGTNGGLCRHQRKTGSFTTFGHRPGDLTSLGSDRVRAIHEDASGTLWVGTYGGGLNRFDTATETFTRFGTDEGLPSNVVYGITEDELGRLWLSTNQGLTRFNPATSAVRTWHQYDGLQNNEFNAGAWLRTSRGEMLFGGISGFNIFRPERIEDNPHPPPVAFTGFRVFNRPVPPGPDAEGRVILERQITEASEVTLTHRDYVVTIEFAALHFAAPEKNTFAYRMVGFEEQWNHVGGRGYATYTNLPPGRYTFRVIAANKDGVWNRDGASLSVTVLPPFWSTAWFRALAALLLIFLVLAIHALRTRRIRERNRLLEEMNTRLNRQIAERVRAEEAQQESEERYRTLFEDSPLGVCHLDEKGRLLECNKKLVEILGHSRSALVGKRISDVNGDEKLRRAVDQSMTSSRIGFYEGQLSTRNPGLQTQVRAMFKRITLESGAFLGAMGVVEDITEGKRLESQLRQSQKMEAVGRLAGGVAHDFNNLLTVILGYTELLLSRLDNADPSHRPVALIDSAGRRAASVTSQLLAFSRKQILKPEVLRLNDLIIDMEKMLRPLLGESVQLVTSLHPTLWPMEADPGQIEQALMNLIINARDAMPEGGLLTIRTGTVTLREPLHQGTFAIPAGDHVTLEVADNGSGMDRNTRRRVFDPFFTTKEKGKGTGLGLSTVYGIVKQSGGFILVESTQGEGAVFRMFFPRSEEPEQELEPLDERLPTDHHGSETILLVEDEEAVRTLLTETLKEQGYRLFAAADGEQALAAAGSLEGPLHLILTDVVMPGISGPELVDRLRPLHPGARILYMSGYTDEVIVQHGVLEPGVTLLNKPLNIHSLLVSVRRALDE